MAAVKPCSWYVHHVALPPASLAAGPGPAQPVGEGAMQPLVIPDVVAPVAEMAPEPVVQLGGRAGMSL